MTLNEFVEWHRSSTMFRWRQAVFNMTSPKQPYSLRMVNAAGCIRWSLGTVQALHDAAYCLDAVEVAA